MLLEDLLTLWGKHYKEKKHLLIFLDCCHAGQWVVELAEKFNEIIKRLQKNYE